MEALEHRALGKERLWRHDGLSHQSEAERGRGKRSAGWTEEPSFTYTFNDM